jgi:hypothetical protein
VYVPEWHGRCKVGMDARMHVVEKHYIRKKNPPKVNLPFTGETTIHTEESDEFDVKEIEVTKNRPFFEQKPLGTVFVDPKWRHSNQIWKAGYVIDRQYLTFNDLNKLRGNCKHNADGTYTIQHPGGARTQEAVFRRH